jgi:hypothetical protein
MMGWILRIEDLQKSIENPTWEEVYRYLKSLDGKNVTAVYLESKDGFLMAGGGEVIKGRTRYIVEYFNQGDNVIEEDSAILINEDGNEDLVDEDEDFIHMNINQVGTDVFVGHLVEFPQVVSAFRHFYETGRLSEDLSWE